MLMQQKNTQHSSKTHREIVYLEMSAPVCLKNNFQQM